MQELLVALLLFISQNSNLKLDNVDDIKVVFVDRHQMAMVTHKGRLPRGIDYASESVVGLFHQRRNTIYLSDSVELNTVYGRSVLLHELVHYMQHKNGLYASSICLQALERPAYELTNKYLVANDLPALFDEEHIAAAMGMCRNY